MELHLTLSIWLSLLLDGLGVSLWGLPTVFLGCCRSSWTPMALGLTDLLGGLQTVWASKEMSSYFPEYSCSPRRECVLQTLVFIAMSAEDLLGELQISRSLVE